MARADRSVLRLSLMVLAAALLGAVAVTWWALEASDVAIVTTIDTNGSPHGTHVWFVAHEGTLWLEAGTPENPWYLDVLEHPEIHIASEDHDGRYRAEPVPGEGARDRVRALLHEKYGGRDTWVGLFVDASRSVAVRLVPFGEPSGRVD